MIALYIVGSIALMSLVEYLVHRFHMHGPGWLNILSPTLYESHAKAHHVKYSDRFDHDVADDGKDDGLPIPYLGSLILATPVLAGMYLIDWRLAAIFLSVLLLYHFTWNVWHGEMHEPTNRIFTRNAIYRAIARHHYMHHKHVNRNYGGVFPWWDMILSTYYWAKPHEVFEMRRIGLYDRTR